MSSVVELPTTMSGMVLKGHGGLDQLQWRTDLPVPVPGPDEVLIKVRASAINNTDINTRTAWYSKAVRGDTAESAASHGDDADGAWSGAPLHFPRIQGADCCGEIVATGSAVSQARIGERVLVRTLQSTGAVGDAFATWTFGSECDGAFAEYAKTFANDALPVRSAWDDVELASIPCAYSTAEGMLQRVGLRDEPVLITGASGGVGSAAVQLAKLRGAPVTAVSSPSKAADLLALGADLVVDRDASFPPDTFDVVVDVVGGPRWQGWIGALCRGGRYVTAGAIAGPIVELDLRTLYLRDLTFFGCTHQPDTIMEDLVRYIEADRLHPVIAQRYPLRELHAAQGAFLEKAHVGKIGIEVG